MTFYKQESLGIYRQEFSSIVKQLNLIFKMTLWHI